MIIPSIDLMDGEAVQLIGGEEEALRAGDPRPLANLFAYAGEVAVIDLDAALGRETNAPLIESMLERAPCRVGGGIRDLDTARRWLDRGAAKIIVGTAAEPALLEKLPRERVIVALDARDGEVVVDGWRTRTGRTVEERLAELRDLAGGFLVTCVEREGRMGGLDADLIERLVAAAGTARLTIAGGVRDVEDVATADRLGADAQVGMALYTGRLGLAEAVTAPMRTDRADGLWPTIVADEHGVALGLVYSSLASIRESIRTGRGVYHSRSRGGLWAKGETSGAIQTLRRIDLDCDRDALRFTVRQEGTGFCHESTRTCFGEDRGLPRLARRLAARRSDAPSGSYTARLLADSDLLGAKLREEASELAEARGREAVVSEAADVLYFTLTKLASVGGRLEDVEDELDRRGRRLTRRAGDAKPAFVMTPGDNG